MNNWNYKIQDIVKLGYIPTNIKQRHIPEHYNMTWKWPQKLNVTVGSLAAFRHNGNKKSSYWAVYLRPEFIKGYKCVGVLEGVV